MFDKNGNMRQWWSNKTVEEYVNRTVCFINQYASYYIPEADDHVCFCIPIGCFNYLIIGSNLD